MVNKVKIYLKDWNYLLILVLCLMIILITFVLVKAETILPISFIVQPLPRTVECLQCHQGGDKYNSAHYDIAMKPPSIFVEGRGYLII